MASRRPYTATAPITLQSLTNNTIHQNNTTKYIGINNENPISQLDVTGDIRAYSANGVDGILLSSAGGVYISNKVVFGSDSASLQGREDGNTGGKLEIKTMTDGEFESTPKVTINNAGAIGLGTGPDFGVPGAYLTSQGGTSPPTWAAPPIAYASLTSSTAAGVPGQIVLPHATLTNIRLTSSLDVTNVGITTDHTNSPFPVTFANPGVYKISGFVTNLGVSGSRSLSIDGRLMRNIATPTAIILFGYFEATGESEVIAPVPFECIYQTTTANESIFMTLNARASNSVSTQIRQFDTRVNIVRIA